MCCRDGVHTVSTHLYHFLNPANYCSITAILAYLTVFMGHLQLVYFGADLLHMIKTIKQSTRVNAHPHKKSLDFLIFIDNV